MTPKQAQHLIDAIYQEKYKPEGLENSSIATAREQIRRGFITVDIGAKLEAIYRKAAGGGEEQARQFIGGNI